MATLKEFEDLLRQAGMANALTILESLRKRDREKRAIAPARRIAGKKMTADLARTILDLHATTGMTQQEIAFKLGVNQGRVNEVVKRGKWLSGDPKASEALSRDKAMDRLAQRAESRRAGRPAPAMRPSGSAQAPVPAPPPSSGFKPADGRGPARVAAVAQGRLQLRPEERIEGNPEAVTPGATAPKANAPGASAPKASAPKVERDAKVLLRRAETDAPKPRIVSAQLAFLDL